MARKKTIKELAGDYLNDPRWKQIKEYSDKGQFKEAVRLCVKITDIRCTVSNAAFDLPYEPLTRYETIQEYFNRVWRTI